MYLRGLETTKKIPVPKNASMIDYKHSTGFEAVVGYLYLKGDKDRLDHIISLSIGVIESDQNQSNMNKEK